MAAPMTYWVRDNPITGAENKADDVKNTFSSWDNCMKKDYCKWPAIVLIVIASLIVASIVFCLVRCICCGLECCCGCFSCLNSCCSCCQPRRSRWGGRDRYRDEPPAFGGPTNYGGYQPTPSAPVYVNVQAPPAPSRYEPSRQYASFDSPAKRSAPSPQPYSAHDDSLPAMPSWKESQSKHIETEEEEVEMDHLNNYSSHQPMLAGSAVPARSGPTPSQQVPGQGLYSDSGDLGEGHEYHDGHGYHDGHDGSAAFAGAAGAVGGAAVAGGAAHAYDQYHHQQQYQQDSYDHHGYTSPVQQTGVTGFGSPPPAAGAGYAQPPPQQYPQHPVSPPARSNFASPPPPSYHTAAPISPASTPGPAGLPASLAAGGSQPSAPQQGYQAYGGGGGGSGGQQYTAYQPNSQPAHGTWHDV